MYFSEFFFLVFAAAARRPLCPRSAAARYRYTNGSSKKLPTHWHRVFYRGDRLRITRY